MELFPLLIALLLYRVAQSISPITPKGSKLYDENGDQFYAKGVAYSSPAYATKDVLADGDQCQVDAGMMRTLGVNTINVYYVDVRNDHSACMQTFASQGIYVWLSLTAPTITFDRTKPSWTKGLFDHFSQVIDQFAKYDNILAFTIGNEVINDAASTVLAPYLKAAVRDMKAYRDARGYRPIPIGYSATEEQSLRQLSGDYLACGDEADALDIYGMIVYSWCNDSSNYIDAGYDKLYLEFQKFPKPVLFTETGCNKDNIRTFSDVFAMLGPVFEPVFSGAIVYEWSLDDIGYGIVKYNKSDNTGFPTTLPGFDRLSTVFSQQNPTGTPALSYTPSNTPPECPTPFANWSVSANAVLPTIANLRLDQISAVTTYITPLVTGLPSSTSSQKTSATASGSSDARTSSESILSKSNTSTKIAIAAGVVGGLLVLAGIGACFLVRRRRRAGLRDSNHSTTTNHDESDDMLEHKPELPAQSVRPVKTKAELDSGISTMSPWRRLTRVLNTEKVELNATDENLARSDINQTEIRASKHRTQSKLYELPAS